jgi:hypothetical protein
MKLTTTTRVRVDGVMQGNGGRDENADPGFERRMGQAAMNTRPKGPDMALDPVESRAFPKSITIQVYRPGGRPQYAADVPDPRR